MNLSSLLMSLLLSGLSATSCPTTNIEVVSLFARESSPQSSNAKYGHRAIVPQPFLPSRAVDSTSPPPSQEPLKNRSKDQKGTSKIDSGKMSRADRVIMNQKLQASNRNTILGWILGVYGLMAVLALAAWYFDIMPGFGRDVEVILQGQKGRQAEEWRDGDVEMRERGTRENSFQGGEEGFR